MVVYHCFPSFREMNVMLACDSSLFLLFQELKSYLDSSKNGVIYISFGTNVEPSSLPPERLQILVKVLGRVPYDVLWKWNKDELPGKTENMRISKWLPQSDLLSKYFFLLQPQK